MDRFHGCAIRHPHPKILLCIAGKNNITTHAISTQEGSAPQASCNLEAMAAHLSDNVLQITTVKIMNSAKTRKRNFQAGNKALKDSAADGAACSSLASREHSIRENEPSRSKIFERSDVRFPIDSCTAQGTDMNNHKMKSADLPGNLEEVYQKYRENENVSSLNSGSLQEGKKRRKKRGRKRHNRCKKATSQDSPAPTAADNSGLMTFLSENCTSGLKPEEQRKKQDQNKAPMTNLVLVNNAKRSEPFGVNLEGAIEKSCELGTNSLDSTFENRYELSIG
ncbi:uncharacterized protein [Miscanthus floridulus]|uniref:uncharacterized protein n=1 Tax=Miscanthus floridulus TaxID=154761 RepID=UPI0034585885